MIQLYYAPYACSLSPHIALRESKLPFELALVDFKRGKKLPDGRDFTAVNPKGYVPALVLDNGQLLTEGAVMVQYIADLAPDAKLAPPNGTFERVRLQEWLNFIATELHKGASPLYAPTATDEYKQTVKDRLLARFGHLGEGVAKSAYLLGDRFTVADGYAFYVMRAWQRVAKAELPASLVAYHARIAERPAVQAALAAEGIT